MKYSIKQQETLLDIARDSLHSRVERDQASEIDTSQFEIILQEPTASFVTLKKYGHLRGCIGSLEATVPLVQDVANNAYQAGFHDPRFAAVSTDELPLLQLQISILSQPEPLLFNNEKDLLQKLRVGKDGLILKEKGYQSTFLPVVWESLSTPASFIEELKVKAGLPANYWSDTIRFYRYYTDLISST